MIRKTRAALLLEELDEHPSLGVDAAMHRHGWYKAPYTRDAEWESDPYGASMYQNADYPKHYIHVRNTGRWTHASPESNISGNSWTELGFHLSKFHRPWER